MSYKPILLIHGEPKGVFLEIFFKSLKKIKNNSPLILIASKSIVISEMKKIKLKKKIKIIDKKSLLLNKLDNSCINIIDVKYKKINNLKKKTNYANHYIKNCFETAFVLIKKFKIKKVINGPINKKTFLNKKYPGITEYFSSKFKIKNNAMLIFNKNLSVCPITTHLPLKHVSRDISKWSIIEKTKLINKFYEKYLKKKPRIAILGLNPHCETIDKYDEDEKIVRPSVKYLKKYKYKIYGPFSADTMFISQNRKKFDVILGMYHDQVLAPIKTLFEYDAINITLGLPFIRISPDHGPNEKMYGKNLSNPLSLIRAISFLDKN